MRRNDRNVTDPIRIREIIDACHCCRLGMCDNGQAYIVPLNFGYTQDASGNYTFYFHGAGEGRKIDLMRANPSVSFEMDTGYRVQEAGQACGWSAAFCCVMGEGTVTFLESLEEKRTALNQIMSRISGKGDWGFPDAALNKTCVYKLEVQALSCKEHL